MKRNKLLIPVLCFCLFFTGCSSQTDAAAPVQTEKPQTAAASPAIPTQAESIEDTQITRTLTEREILAQMENCSDKKLALDTADYMITKAETLSERVLGKISSEEDAIEKTRIILTEIGAADYIEDAESDYVEIDGELVKYERTGPCWYVEYFPEYDAWRVTPALPSGVTEDGRKVGAPGMPPYVILRGADGAVMGVFY